MTNSEWEKFNESTKLWRPRFYNEAPSEADMRQLYENEIATIKQASYTEGVAAGRAAERQEILHLLLNTDARNAHAADGMNDARRLINARNTPTHSQEPKEECEHDWFHTMWGWRCRKCYELRSGKSTVC